MGLELQELIKFAKLFDLEGFYAQREEGGTYRILFGNDDPMVELQKLEMENALLKAQLEAAMDMYYRDLGIRGGECDEQAVCARRAN